jgi:hypothetical protein
MRLTWTPHEASEAEIACFAAAKDNMGKGWAAGMELLAELLAECRLELNSWPGVLDRFGRSL